MAIRALKEMLWHGRRHAKGAVVPDGVRRSVDLRRLQRRGCLSKPLEAKESPPVSLTVPDADEGQEAAVVPAEVVAERTGRGERRKGRRRGG